MASSFHSKVDGGPLAPTARLGTCAGADGATGAAPDSSRHAVAATRQIATAAARVAAARGQPDRALVFLADAVKNGAQVWQLMEEGGALPSMEPDFAELRGLPAFRKAVGFW
jgi:hypothetical protein